jgi:hypothetical protein
MTLTDKHTLVFGKGGRARTQDKRTQQCAATLRRPTHEEAALRLKRRKD